MTDPQAWRLINWQQAYEGSAATVTWDVEPFLETGTLNTVYCDPKDGKSLLMQSVSAARATGGSALGGPPAPQVPVLYIDYENNLQLVVERLTLMGYEWQNLQGWLHYASYPDIPRMDTPEGGQAVCQMAGHLRAGMVVYDTTSKVIGGAENSADTFADLYRYTHVPLMRAGVTQVRLDHSGKDADRGQRGSSAKNADVDVVWRLISTKNAAGLITRIRLDPEYRRADHASGWDAACLQGPLRFRIGRMPLSPQQQVLEKELARIGVPPGTGRDVASAALKAAGVKFRTDNLTAVLRHIKTDLGSESAQILGSDGSDGSGSGIGSGGLPDPPGQMAGQAGQMASDLLGQGLGQVGQQTWVNDPTRSVGQDQSRYWEENDWADLYHQTESSAAGRRELRKKAG